MRWRSAASLGLVSLTLLAAAAPAEAATAEMGAVGFINGGGVPQANPDFLAGVQTAEGALPSDFRSYVVPPGYGVITQWSYSTGVNGGPLGFAVMRDYPGGQYVSIATEVRTVTAGRLHRFATRMPVRPGDRLALASEHQGGQPALGLYLFGQVANRVLELTDYALGDPQPGVPPEKQGRLLAVAARVETDADGDGFGDDTQDLCPSRADLQTACPANEGGPGGRGRDQEKPKVGKPRLSATVFKAASSGGAIAAGGRTVPVGTRVTFSASEASSVRFRVQRRASGRRVGKKCKAPTRRNRAKKRCIRYAAVKGAFTIDAKVGTNTFTFRGRMGGKKLKPGRYRLTGRATDRAKNASAVPPKGFRIVD